MKIVVLLALVFAIVATVVAIVRNKRGHNRAWVALVVVWLVSSGLGLWGTMRHKPERAAEKPATPANANASCAAAAAAVDAAKADLDRATAKHRDALEALERACRSEASPPK
ncbi:MAG TPA: hypothetical protein VM261_15820 [Kofleriaceae bacterium]|nr:hypothetical protein [Kofleriaceae bacterium]